MRYDIPPIKKQLIPLPISIFKNGNDIFFTINIYPIILNAKQIVLLNISFFTVLHRTANKIYTKKLTLKYQAGELIGYGSLAENH